MAIKRINCQEDIQVYIVQRQFIIIIFQLCVVTGYDDVHRLQINPEHYWHRKSNQVFHKMVEKTFEIRQTKLKSYSQSLSISHISQLVHLLLMVNFTQKDKNLCQ